MNKKNALKVEKLTKIYSKKSSNETKALNNLNLEVKEGEIFGLLGPNNPKISPSFTSKFKLFSAVTVFEDFLE